MMELADEEVGMEETDHHVMLTDLEKCYDGIWREGLYFSLSCMGIEGDMLQNIKAWLETIVIYPEWNGVEGHEVKLREGLKQGCVLSPILCIVFMNSWAAEKPNVVRRQWVKDLVYRAGI